MPAYRSSAEGEIRDAVIEHLRQHRPGCRVIHEINVGDLGHRIDVLAVSPSELIAVEIKSERDTLTRLQDQVKAFERCAHHTIVALHERFLVERTTNRSCAHVERRGTYFMHEPPRVIGASELWVYPRRRRALPGCHDFLERWRMPNIATQQSCPSESLGMLWCDELMTLCRKFRVSIGARSRKNEMRAALLWHCTGREITQGICAALMARQCTEADPPIHNTAEQIETMIP